MLFLSLNVIMTTNSVICPKCRGEVHEKQEGLLCDDCDGWFHRTCINKRSPSYMTQKRYRQIKKRGEEFAWMCDHCDNYIRRLDAQTNDVNVSNQPE